MEHQLRKFMSQKQTDCKPNEMGHSPAWCILGNYIAEQLGVPSPYVVRKAAFISENQLRDIHQQLRRSGNRRDICYTATIGDLSAAAANYVE